MNAVLIANPSAGRGRTRWPEIRAALAAAGIDAAERLTQRPGHATELAAEAAREGVGLVIAGGGDGTVHEVANGLLSVGGSSALGVLPLGSGCDYAKTFGIPDDVGGAIERMASQRPPKPVDAGRITYVGSDGSPAERWFVNIAEVGIGPATVARAASLPRFLGGAVYGLAFLATLPRYRPPRADITMASTAYQGPLMNLVVAIGQVFGGGMRVAPQADPSDGAFDVQVHFPSKATYVGNLPKVYRGTHLPHREITEARTASLDITCEPVALIEADGEVLGTTPASFRIEPGALHLKA